MASSCICGGKSKFITTIIVLLVMSRVVRESSGNLPGSCIAAGYIECCDPSESDNFCSGVPMRQCYCDPSCIDSGDCCEDIQEICPSPEVDVAILSLVPAISLLDSISFHTASFHWTVAPYETQSLLNGSFYEFVLLTVPKWSDLPDTSSSIVTTYSTPNINSLANDRISFLYNFDMLNLDKNTSYGYRLTAISNYGTNETVANGLFTTLDYPSIESVHLQAFDTSVRVSWLSPILPSGVTTVQYKIYYEEHRVEQQGGGGGGGEEEGEKMFQSFLPDKTERMIHHLHLDQLYRFSVAVEVLEINDVIYELVSSQDGVEVFVPGSSYFQLVTNAELSCDEWTILDENKMLEIFLSSVIKLIQASCNCDYPRENVREQSLSCISNGTTSSSQLTYRAQLLSIVGFSSSRLVSYLETWRQKGPSIGKWTHKQSISNLTIDSSQRCSAGINFKGAPLCAMKDFSQRIPGFDPDQKSDVPLTIFITAILAESVFLLTLMLVIVIIMARALSRSKHRIGRTESYDLPVSITTSPESLPPTTEKLDIDTTLTSQQLSNLYNDTFLQ